MKFILPLTTSIIFSLSSFAVAQQNTPTNQSVVTPQPANTTKNPKSYNHIYLGFGTIGFDSQAAAKEKIKDSANYWRLGWEKIDRRFVYGLGISGYQYSDLSALSSVRVVDQNRKESTAKSGANATNLYFEGGYHYTLNPSFHLEVLTGFEFITYSKRGFASCTNCPGEDINIDAGLYVMPRISYTAKSWFSATLAYHSYLMGDISGAYSVTLGAHF